MAEKSYLISSVKSVRGDPELLGNILEGTGDVIDISGVEIETLKDYAFSKSSAKEIKLPNTITKIGECCFQSAQNIEYIDLSNVKIFPRYSFSAMGSLKNIISKPKIIADYALQNAGGQYDVLSSLLDTSELEYIGNSATPQRNSDDNFILPNVIYIGNYSARYLKNIPNSVRALGSNNYSSTSTSSEYEIVEDKLHYKKTDDNNYAWLVYSSASGDVTLNSNVKGIAGNVLGKTFTSLTLPESLEYFSPGWAYSCKVTKLNIPSLDWWFSRDFNMFNYFNEKLINGNSVYTGSSQYSFKDSNYNTVPENYNLYVDGVQVDDVTELELPVTAGRGCLSSFSNLEKLTIILPKNFKYGSNHIGNFFPRKSRTGYINATTAHSSLLYTDDSTDSKLSYKANHITSIGELADRYN